MIRASRKVYGSNSFFQSHIKILCHQQKILSNKEKYSLPSKVSGVLLYKFTVGVITTVLKFTTLKTKWGINSSQSRILHPPPSKLHIIAPMGSFPLVRSNKNYKQETKKCLGKGSQTGIATLWCNVFNLQGRRKLTTLMDHF